MEREGHTRAFTRAAETHALYWERDLVWECAFSSSVMDLGVSRVLGYSRDQIVRARQIRDDKVQSGPL